MNGISKPENSSPKVTVIIPCYAMWRELDGCLQAIAKNDYPKEAVEVVVVNNEGGERFIGWWGDLNVVQIMEAKPGAYAARNAGLRVARGDIIAFTDADCVPTPKWLSSGVAAILSGNHRVGGPIFLFSSRQTANLAERHQFLYAFRTQNDFDVREHFATANVFVSKSALTTVGSFNESAFSGADLEWSWRFSNLDLKSEYNSEVSVWHPARSTLPQLFAHRKRLAGGVRNFPRQRQLRRWLFRKITTANRRYKGDTRRGGTRPGALVTTLHATLVLYQLFWIGVYLVFPAKSTPRQ